MDTPVLARSCAKGVNSPKLSSLALTSAAAKLLEASLLIETVPPNGNDIACMHSVLCQVGLPRSKVIEREFMRQSGAAWINVQAGMLDEGQGAVAQPIPYGPLPRLALAWISTYAKRHRSREVPIGSSAAEFLRHIGLESQGARYSTLRMQMHALAACRLQVGYRGRTFDAHPIAQFDAWIQNRESTQRPLWPGTLVLAQDYFIDLMDSAVPLDNRALMALKGSALALDIYTWLANRLYRIEGRAVTVHWSALREQFGQEYKGKNPDKDFKKVREGEINPRGEMR